ncbi:MAG: TIGR03089 family protein [Nocardioides sp.]
MTTFSDVLGDRLRHHPEQPLVTYYDLATGERTELSVTTYANWVAKTAGLLADQLDIERGGVVVVDLPTHWLGAVVLGAVWQVGAQVRWPDAPREARPEVTPPDLVVCGPEGLAGWADASTPVLASALLPMAARFADPPPPGVVDLGVEVWAQPDAFVAFDPAAGEDVAVEGVSHDELWSRAAAGTLLEEGGRLVTEANPASRHGLPCLTQPLSRGGSLVLVTRADPKRFDATYAAERGTARFPGHPARS